MRTGSELAAFASSVGPDARPAGGSPMQIRAGFEITYECPQPTPMVLLLSLHPTRLPDLVVPAATALKFDPPLEAWDYRDIYLNTCPLVLAPAGRLTVSSDFVVNDCGAPDIVEREADQLPVQALPDDVLVYLLCSRYCDTDHLSNLAWTLFGGGPSGWARVQAIC